MKRANLKNTTSEFAANFQNANMHEVNLEGANLYKCKISGTDFQRSTVDSSTSMYQCEVDSETDFRCVALDSIGIDATTKRLLEVNIRRKNWDDWYWRTTWQEEKKLTNRNLVRYITTVPIRFFWWIADYGASPRNIIKAFFLVLFLFAFIYWGNSKSISNLQSQRGISSEKTSRVNSFIRCVYFSTVTMTTLGYGDIHPEKDSKWMQIAVIVQVLMSYMLLGALITYLGILFTSGGPFLIYSYPLDSIP